MDGWRAYVCNDYNKGHTGVMGNRGEGLKIGNVELWVPDCFRVYWTFFTGDCCLQLIRLCRIDKLHSATSLWKGIIEEPISPLVQIICRDNFIADLGCIDKSNRLCRLSGRDCKRTTPTLKGGHSSFENIIRGIHYAKIHRVQLTQGT